MSSGIEARQNHGGRFYHPELDVLRFFAFSLVFAVHASVPAASLLQRGWPSTLVNVIEAFIPAGGFGVDLFFVLSAYLITELLLRERSIFGRLDVRSFYVRRILRIWPLYFAFLFVASAASGWLTGRQDSWRIDLAFSLLAGNWWIVFRDLPSLAICPLWTVSVEEQFYLAWPPLVRRLSRHQMLFTCVGMMGIAVIAQVFLVLHHSDVEHIWCNSLVHLEAIGSGILAAVLLKGRSPRLPWPARVALFLAGFAGFLVAAGYLHMADNPVRMQSTVLGYALISLGSVAMLISVLTEARPWFAHGALVYLGRISYGLYVFHYLCLILAERALRRFPVHHAIRGGLPLAFLLTVVLAALSYRFFETPFLRLKERFARIPSRPLSEPVELEGTSTDASPRFKPVAVTSHF